jgi:hypothetical protein
MLKLGWVTTTPSFFWLGWAIVQSSYHPHFFFLSGLIKLEFRSDQATLVDLDLLFITTHYYP